jgi:NAD(P)-dependent dehydrogenase (short-subunit alcohol dehydrogenase family)
LSGADDPRETRSELLSPNGRVVMISGASRGIGAALARRLLLDGFRLSLGVRRPADVRAKYAEADAPRVLVCPFDAFDAKSAESWVAATASASAAWMG